MSAQYHIIIPARLASQRLPNKPLVEIAGRSLIEHVYRRACSANAESVIIATDSALVCELADGFGATAVMTSADHQSGSDRIAECIGILGWSNDTLVVNLQGDEPLMPATCLDQVAELLQQSPSADAASLYLPISDPKELEDSNVVKVVTAQSGQALYFSRSMIPFPRGLTPEDVIAGETPWNRHVGLYAYRAGALLDFTQMPPGELEALEKLEQLRFLESGRIITMARAADYIPAGVDSPEDLERVRKALSLAG
jgi:3-deoxy-manno-octulosonate cytidylyltransferase (CMP-KDO synthetase)